MNFRIIFIALLAFLISSCSEDQPVKHKVASTIEEVNSTDDNIDESPKAFNKDVFSIDKNDIVQGNKDSKVVLIEYSSPTCPHCSYFHKEILPLLKEKYIDSGKIAYILREFVTNKQDLDAVLLGRCYENEKDPLKLLNILYIQQDNWAFNKNYREILTNMGGLAGISQEKYIECLSRKNIIDFLLSQARLISNYPGFIGTPAFFINGEMHQGAYSLEGLSQSIDAELDRDEAN